MKYFLTLTIIIFLTACNQSGRHNSDTKIKATLIDTSITDNNGIIGQWTMCSTYGNGLMTNYNVCPIVTFGTYGTGSIIFASGPAETFKWTLKNRALTISNMVKKSNNTFSDTTYTASIGKEKNLLQLQIRDITKDGVFYLSKYFDINK